MKIRNLFLIRLMMILLTVLCLSLFTSCSAERKAAKIRKRTEEYWEKKRQAEQARRGKYSSPSVTLPSEKKIEKEILYAVVNEDEVPVYYHNKEDSESVDYFHRGDLIGVYAETNETAPDMYELSSLKGLINKKHLDFIILPTEIDRKTTLTNSKEMKYEVFPLRKSFGFEHMNMCYEENDMPPYLDSEDDWVLLSKIDRFWDAGYEMTLHVKDLPQYFDVLIYAPDESRYLTFCKERREIWLGEYEEFLDDEEKKILNRISPLYVVYGETPFSIFSGTCKTQIRSKSGSILFSGYFDYPETNLNLQRFGKWNLSYYLNYATEKPFYIVIYKTVFGSEDPSYGFERVPVKAFAAYPEDGVWNGVLNFYENEFGVGGEYRLYFYRLDENNPKDYTQTFGGYWYNQIGNW